MNLRRQLLGAVVVLTSVFALGAAGLWLIGGGKWSLGECGYMVVITLTTVGFGEEVLPGFAITPLARPFTIVLLIAGMGSVLYFVSNLTAAIIEGEVSDILRLKRMKKKISELDDHFVVCGAGSTGARVISELLATGQALVVIDRDEHTVEQLKEDHPDSDIYFLVGDATSDELLTEANLTAARGVVAALGDDKDNVYLVVSARQLNPTVRIVARGTAPDVLTKLRYAGADGVVSPNQIGGVRLVAELIKPGVAHFFDRVRSGDEPVDIEELEIPASSSYAGKSLIDSGLRARTQVLVLAARKPEADSYEFHPEGDFELEPGMTLVVLGPTTGVRELKLELGAAER